jgi:predicted HTH transcriptional regulator
MSDRGKAVPHAGAKDRGEVEANFSLEELVAFVEDHTGGKKLPQQPGEISCRDFAERNGCTIDTARKRLDTMVEKGLMEKRIAKSDKNIKTPIAVYRKKG